jgi:hypothetical protein
MIVRNINIKINATYGSKAQEEYSINELKVILLSSKIFRETCHKDNKINIEIDWEELLSVNEF